ncbi:hypothetical protein BH10BDE1_BH10BDE1_25890 [soil metagenome]
MAGLRLEPAAALESLLRPTVMIGSGVMVERANDNVSESTRLPLSFGAGARFDQWAARIEYGTFHTTDGNATISTSRDFETMLAWTSYDFGRETSWTPYAAAAFGMARTSTETRLAQTFESAKGTWTGLFALAAGFRGEWMPHLYVRPELRYESAESFKTKDARMGAFVQLDFIY